LNTLQKQKMMSGFEIFLLIMLIAAFITGWVLFIVFYDYWQNPRLTPQDDAGWLRATIGLILGIVSGVGLLFFAFIVGAKEYNKKHAADFKKKLELVQHHMLNPIPKQ
jgi:heme/copper-type cytochrome/quinol oxidase subunit 2